MKLVLSIPDDVWTRVVALSPPSAGNSPLIVLQTAINVGLPILEALTFGPHAAWRQIEESSVKDRRPDLREDFDPTSSGGE